MCMYMYMCVYIHIYVGNRESELFKLFTLLDPHRSKSNGKGIQQSFTLLDVCVSSLRRGHANLLCVVPILTDDPRRETENLSCFSVCC